MSDELPSGVSYSSVDHEFNVNESTVDIKVSLHQNMDKTKLCIGKLMKRL